MRLTTFSIVLTFSAIKAVTASPTPPDRCVMVRGSRPFCIDHHHGKNATATANVTPTDFKPTTTATTSPHDRLQPFGPGPVVEPEDKMTVIAVQEKREEAVAEDKGADQEERERLALEYCTHENIGERLRCAKKWIKPYKMSEEVASEIAHKDYTGVVFD